jgi:hypothetical protein
LQQHKVRVANLSDQKKFWQAKHRELEVAAAGKKARQIAAGNPTTNSTAGDNENVPTGGGTTAGGNEKNSTGGNPTTNSTAGCNENVPTGGGTTAGGNEKNSTGGNPTTNSTAVGNENVPTGGGTTAGGNEKNSTGGNTPTDATAGGNEKVPIGGGTTAGGNEKNSTGGNTPTDATAGGNKKVPIGGGTTAGGNEKNSTGGNTPTNATAGGNKRDLLIVIMAIMLASYKFIDQTTAVLGYSFVPDVSRSEVVAWYKLVDVVMSIYESFDVPAQTLDNQTQVTRLYLRSKELKKWSQRVAVVKKAAPRFALVVIAVACGYFANGFV